MGNARKQSYAKPLMRFEEEVTLLRKEGFQELEVEEDFTYRPRVGRILCESRLVQTPDFPEKLESAEFIARDYKAYGLSSKEAELIRRELQSIEVAQARLIRESGVGVLERLRKVFTDKAFTGKVLAGISVILVGLATSLLTGNLAVGCLSATLICFVLKKIY